ncbi:hypothetical protein AVEN_99281-1, partial [Araneus ventricosus]
RSRKFGHLSNVEEATLFKLPCHNNVRPFKVQCACPVSVGQVTGDRMSEKRLAAWNKVKYRLYVFQGTDVRLRVNEKTYNRNFTKQFRLGQIECY